MTDTAYHSPDFRRRYFPAQAARNARLIDAATRRLAEVGGAAGRRDELMEPGSVSGATPLSGTDLRLLLHTKRPHLSLRADGTRRQEVLRSVRPTASAIPGPPPPKPGEPPQPPRRRSLRGYLANDAIRTTAEFTITEDDVIGVDWASSNFGTPAQAEHVTVPALLMTNTRFQFVVSAEIVLDLLASKDKAQVGIKGSDHEFRPCRPEFGGAKTWCSTTSPNG